MPAPQPFWLKVQIGPLLHSRPFDSCKTCIPGLVASKPFWVIQTTSGILRVILPSGVRAMPIFFVSLQSLHVTHEGSGRCSISYALCLYSATCLYPATPSTDKWKSRNASLACLYPATLLQPTNGKAVMQAFRTYSRRDSNPQSPP